METAKGMLVYRLDLLITVAENLKSTAHNCFKDFFTDLDTLLTSLDATFSC
jgi:hypothetical protein